MKAKNKAIIALAALVVTVFSIGTGFLLLKANVDIPLLAYIGASAGVISIVFFISAFSSWRRESKSAKAR
jgi:hypothetical protein